MVSDQATLDISNWDGCLSSTDFYIAASAFAEKWNKFNSALPEWSWILCPNRFGISALKVEGYFSLQNVFFPRSLEDEQDEGSHDGKEEPTFSDKEEPVDAAILVQSNGHKGNHYDFHVVYSPSYRVPVLYFRAYCSDGQPLTRDEIEMDLPTSSAKVLLDFKWTFITQEEHPFLNRPWYTLHPCGTSEWMKLLFANVKGEVAMEQYLESWLSVVGQVFGLRIPLEMLRTST